MNSVKTCSAAQILISVVQGTLIGLGAVLPGISGGVLCVVFGIYKTIISFLANPLHNLKANIMKLLPYGIGGVIGFVGSSRLLSFLLEKYPAPSVCLFIGLICGMLPALFREAGEQGRSKASFVSMGVSMVMVFTLLIGLKLFSVEITPDSFWYGFCGVCLALSVIAPGMSFSTLLMPLGLYEPFVAGIGHMNMAILLPGGIGCLATVILLSRAVDTLFENHHSVAFHAIIGIVIAATIMIIPVASFMESAASCLCNSICIAAGIIAALLLDKFNQKYTT